MNIAAEIKLFHLQVHLDLVHMLTKKDIHTEIETNITVHMNIPQEVSTHHIVNIENMRKIEGKEIGRESTGIDIVVVQVITENVAEVHHATVTEKEMKFIIEIDMSMRGVIVTAEVGSIAIMRDIEQNQETDIYPVEILICAVIVEKCHIILDWHHHRNI